MPIPTPVVSPPVTRSDILRWLAKQPWYVWVVLAFIFCGIVYFLSWLGVLDDAFRYIVGKKDIENNT